jgi:hypothetical protein
MSAQARMGANLTAARLSSSAKADDPVIADLDERHLRSLDQGHTGYWMPAFAGMTTERLCAKTDIR